MSQINIDSSGWICGNQWTIQGAWYCYNDGSDSSNSCKGSDGKGTGAIPWKSSSSAMCISGVASGNNFYAGIGFKVNQAIQSNPSFTSWNASSKNIVGFALTMTGTTGGSTVNIKFPTAADLDPQTKDAPSITVPGVSGTSVTYNALFSDAVLANNSNHAFPVDPTALTDVTVAIPTDSQAHTYDFCITKVTPLTQAQVPSPFVGTGNYGPAWTNHTAQAVNAVNGYAVQSDPSPVNGDPMTMQVTGGTTMGDVGFSYTTGSGFSAFGGGPGAFPAIISGWGPGYKGIQFYGPYRTAKTVSGLSSVLTNWSFSMGGSGDAAYDAWFGTSANPVLPNIELMVWIGYNGKQPIGFGTAAGPAFNGWTPYAGTNPTGQRVVSYLPSSSTNSTPASFDLLGFFKDAATHGYAGMSMGSYFLGVQTGFEVYGGGETWTTKDYNLQIKP